MPQQVQEVQRRQVRQVPTRLQSFLGQIKLHQELCPALPNLCQRFSLVLPLLLLRLFSQWNHLQT